MNQIISVRSAALTYQARNGEVEALRSVSFDMAEGEFVSIVGPSGCGKSTLLGALAGLETLDGGTVELYGRPASGADGRMGFMPQRDQLFEWRSIYDNVMLGLQIRNDRDPAHRRNVEGLLKRYGLWEFAAKRPDQLSGGQCQRVAIARAIVGNPKLLLADEPTGALDSHTGREVLGMLQDLHGQGHTVVLITHDNSIAVQADRIIRLEDGQVVYDGDSRAPEAIVQPTLNFEPAEQEGNK